MFLVARYTCVLCLFFVQLVAWLVVVTHSARHHQVVKLLYKRRNHLHLRRQRMHNHNFGGMFTSHHSATLFAFSLLRYVDFYTSRLSNFLA